MDGSESPEEESEEDDEEDDDDCEEEEEDDDEEDSDDDDEGEEDDDNSEEEDEEEDDEEEEEAEVADACRTEDVPKLPSEALCTSKLDQINDTTNENMMENALKDNEQADQEVSADISQNPDDVNPAIPEYSLCEGSVPGILDLGDDCLVSAVRVEARFSDEDEDDGPKPAQLNMSLQRNLRLHNDNEDDWDDDDDEDKELMGIEGEASQRITLEKQPMQNDDPLEGIADLEVSTPPKVTNTAEDDDDWNDVEEEEELETKKSSKLSIALKGPESPEVSWGSDSDKSDGDKPSDFVLLDPPEIISNKEPVHMDQIDDSEAIPVSMIVGCNDGSDEEQSINNSREEDVSEESDSQVNQMQYDFASGSVRVSETGQYSDVTDNDSVSQDDECIDECPQTNAEKISNPNSPLPSEDLNQESNGSKLISKSTDCFVKGDICVEATEGHPKDDPVQQQQEDIPYTVIDDVNLTSDSDGEDVEQNFVNESVAEERLSKQSSLQVLRRWLG